jgi:chromosome segregation ATPase
LSLLFALTANPPSTKEIPSQSVAPPAVEPVKADPRVELAAAARAELSRAEKTLAEMRERSEHAVESLRDAIARLDAAERALLQAQAEREARRDDVERTRRHVQSTAADLDAAQRAFDDARGMTESTELRPKVRSAEGRSDH